ncbi:MAG: alpha/beta fold hydrolase [Bacillaceae bacterium]
MEIVLKSIPLPNGENMAYRERQGGEEVVLFIHGNMISSKHWEPVLENFDEAYTLYAVDMRGFGLSTYHHHIRSIKELSEDIKLFVTERGLTSFHLVGWSTGGAVAMQYAATYPDECKSITLLASASTRGYPFMLTNDGVSFERALTYEEVANDSIRTIPVQQAYNERDKEYLRQLWNTLIYRRNQPPADIYDAYLDDLCTQRNLADIYYALNMFNISHVHNGFVAGTGEVGQIICPVHIMHGDEDIVITKEMTEELIEDLGERATFTQLKGCGHSPLVDDLSQLLQEMHLFLKQKEAQK